MLGFNVTDETVGPLLAGVMVSEACCELLPSVAVINAVVVALTDVVVTVNKALVLPDVTVTLLGTLADPLLLESETTEPPEGAALESVTVPCEELPPVTLVGFRVTEETVGPEGGRMVSEACAELELYVAVITAVVLVVTDVVVTVNEALLLPAGTVTLLGTLADPLLLESVTTAPPVGALAARMTCPVEGSPPVTLVGFTPTEERAGAQEPFGFTVKLVDTVAPPDCP